MQLGIYIHTVHVKGAIEVHVQYRTYLVGQVGTQENVYEEDHTEHAQSRHQDTCSDGSEQHTQSTGIHLEGREPGIS